MAYELMNLTLPTVVQAIEDVLDTYPEYPYQAVFAIHEFRQQLITHILSQTPNRHGGDEDPASRSPGPFSSVKRPHRSPLAERLYLEVMVRGSILHILRENADRLGENFQKAKRIDCSLEPLCG